MIPPYMMPQPNPYANRLAAMEGIQPQTIQSLQQQPQAICYFVQGATEMANINLMPNIVYIGINSQGKELYLRKLNTDGNIEFETYRLESGKQEKNDIQIILDRLNGIEQKLEEKNNVGKVTANVHEQQTSKRP